MTEPEIHSALLAVLRSFPKSGKMFICRIGRKEDTGVFDRTTQLAGEISTKSAWGLEEKEPNIKFSTLDAKVIDFAESIAKSAEESRLNLLVTIDLDAGQTRVWVAPRSRCFIATAACGDTAAPDVIALSCFRDEVLLRSCTGRAFVLPNFAADCRNHRVIEALTTGDKSDLGTTCGVGRSGPSAFVHKKYTKKQEPESEIWKEDALDDE